MYINNKITKATPAICQLKGKQSQFNIIKASLLEDITNMCTGNAHLYISLLIQPCQGLWQKIKCL